MSAFGRQKARAFGEIAEDCVRLGDELAWRGLEHGNGAGRILREKLRRARFAAEDRHRHSLPGETEMPEEHADLVAVLGGQIIVESEHR